MARARTRGASSSQRYPACGALTLQQLVGDRAALNVTADLTPLTPAQQTAVWEPNRLIWCLHPAPSGPGRLVWLTPWHPPDCPHPHVTEHRCPTETAPPFSEEPPSGERPPHEPARHGGR